MFVLAVLAGSGDAGPQAGVEAYIVGSSADPVDGTISRQNLRRTLAWD